MRLRDLAALLRPRIGLLAAAGAAVGAVVGPTVGPIVGFTAERAAGPMTGITAAELTLCLTAAGAFLLAGGCSALNQVQEREADARMERTKARPLPAGRIRPRAALGLALLCLALASLALWRTPGGLGAALFVPLTVLLYNGLYTPLKKHTSLAMLVGGIAGAFPPLVGFAACGGDILDPRALLLAGVFYAWQVPHFWLFARIHQKEYEAAGFFVPQHGVGKSRTTGTLCVWLVGYGALMLLIPAFGLVEAPALKALVAALALAMCLGAWPLLVRERLGFALVNASLLLLLCFLAADVLRLVV